MELPSGIVEPRTSYVGFWPWPRVWGTNEAKELATALPGSTHLETDLNAAQAGLFRSVAARYDGTGFDVQYCAVGLITYRHHGHEEAISQNWEEFRLDPTAPLVPHPVLWTQVNATPPGVARAPRGPRSACDTRASRAARSCCTAPRTRSLRRVPP